MVGVDRLAIDCWNRQCMGAGWGRLVMLGAIGKRGGLAQSGCRIRRRGRRHRDHGAAMHVAGSKRFQRISNLGCASRIGHHRFTGYVAPMVAFFVDSEGTRWPTRASGRAETLTAHSRLWRLRFRLYPARDILASPSTWITR